jgi:hypothetical protein
MLLLLFQTFGPTMSTESGSGLHVSFTYHCCYSPAEKATIREVLQVPLLLLEYPLTYLPIRGVLQVGQW